ncbi:MAG: hypothetical protein DIU84_07805 [Bacillota bacterium]|nr:MAG: hypothetical protein DIU84_07805 [Bacillota bacterium]
MPTANDRIPHRAFAVLVPTAMIQTGVLRGPMVGIEVAGTWSWLSTLLVVSVIFLNVYLLAAVVRRHGSPAYPDLLRELFGPVLGRVVLVLHGLAITLRLARVNRTSAELITLELLDRTPVWAVLVPGLIIAAALARQGFEPVARFSALLVPIYYTGIMVLLALAQLRGDPAMLVDLTEFSLGKVLLAAFRLFGEMQGYSLLLALLPWAWRPERVVGPLMLGVGLVGALSLLLATASASVLGTAAGTMTWPTLELVEAVGAPGLLVERVDAIFFIIWVLSIMDLSALTLVASGYMLTAAVSPDRNPQVAVPIVAAGAAVIALLPPGFLQLEEAIRSGVATVPFIELMLPGTLWLASLLRRGRTT